ncbi:hypothetical protein C475_15228 [Halosimplex carlsbadense 2-9-1]|uniref:Uncharacterized protein n=1 Tax=Halosimplex carlsbadense 2-9-1 TaxID=797114 RepID=M0CK28_9EURY|nr:hypothetical protein [Halosimplex carlsbadense]ELZ23635.1 hypothetical protein C475_15228 [Halosimplex carlsbadense 2-9-1]
MTRHRNRSAFQAYKQLDIGTALALMFFAVVGLVQTGLMLDIVDMLTQYKFLPLAGSFAAYAIVFASSGTRNPQHYHPLEWAIVSVTAVIMTAHATLAEVQTLVTNTSPWSSILIMGLMVVCGAVLGK